MPAAGATLVTFVIALGAATVLGTFLGLAVGASRLADQALGPTLEFARGAMPPAAIVPIAALLLGYEQTMKVTVVTLAAVWPVLLNTRAGVRGKVTFPALLPSIFLGVRLATPVSLVIALLVEIVTQVDGVGALIAISQRNYLADQVYGLILVAGLFSLLVNGLVSALEAYAFRHRPA